MTDVLVHRGPDDFGYLELDRILRQAIAGAIPERISSRHDKVGFETPVTRWIRERLDPDVRPILLSGRAKARGIFEPKRLAARLDARALRGSAGADVFRWLSVELWFRIFIDAEGATA